ncbi:ankyrin repeat domain-containing protein, partial [Sansalvadorimonas verongulae]|uniref:ankyrin repeat domain-containing protein n=1 Tax=Sansalvadorimonas verongulae TaxID=2172824 RepID=UPI0018AD25FF
QPSIAPNTGSQRSTIFVVNQSSSQKKGWTPLHQAAQEGNLERVHQLIQLGANPNSVTEKDNSVLHAAVENGHIGILQALIDDYGANRLSYP